jgi:hypothetical protein
MEWLDVVTSLCQFRCKYSGVIAVVRYQINQGTVFLFVIAVFHADLTVGHIIFFDVLSISLFYIYMKQLNGDQQRYVVSTMVERGYVALQILLAMQKKQSAMMFWIASGRAASGTCKPD